MPGIREVGKTFTRRDFLNASAVAAGAILIASCTEIDYGENVPEIYGADGSIKTKAQFDELYRVLEERFLGLIPAALKNKEGSVQRDYIYGRDKRVLEMVVRKSDFENGPLNYNFVETVKMQIDLMNRINHASGLNMHAVLKRIIVVDDSIAEHPSFNPALDVDHSEYWGDEDGENKILYNYKVKKDGSLEINGDNHVLTLPPPLRPDTFSTTRNKTGKLSMYLKHELLHRLFILGDLKIFEVRGFSIGENLNWLLSPFSVAHGEWNMIHGIRGTFDPLSPSSTQEAISTFLWQIPERVNIKIPGAESVELRFPVMEGAYYPGKNENGGNKHFNPVPDNIVRGDIVSFTKEEIPVTGWFEQKYVKDGRPVTTGHNISIVPTLVAINAEVRGRPVELFLPMGIFVMSKIVANLDNSNYRIQLGNQKIGNSSEILQGDFVTDSEVDGKEFYAKLKIPGTNATFVWTVTNLKPLPKKDLIFPDQPFIDRSNTQQAK